MDIVSNVKEAQTEYNEVKDKAGSLTDYNTFAEKTKCKISIKKYEYLVKYVKSTQNSAEVIIDQLIPLIEQAMEMYSCDDILPKKKTIPNTKNADKILNPKDSNPSKTNCLWDINLPDFNLSDIGMIDFNLGTIDYPDFDFSSNSDLLNFPDMDFPDFPKFDISSYLNDLGALQLEAQMMIDNIISFNYDLPTINLFGMLDNLHRLLLDTDFMKNIGKLLEMKICIEKSCAPSVKLSNMDFLFNCDKLVVPTATNTLKIDITKFFCDLDPCKRVKALNLQREYDDYLRLKRDAANKIISENYTPSPYSLDEIFKKDLIL